MAFSSSYFNRSNASNFASSRNNFNQSLLNSPLNQPWMTKNAGSTPIGNKPIPGFGVSALLANNYATHFEPDVIYEPPFDVVTEENEYKPDASGYGYLTRTIEKAEIIKEQRSRLNSQKSLNGDKQ
uniref:Uncharacterized protein n=1 Tax=Panagrolaimus sp. ES5 TaxID=591445 RepID=A0AC34F7N6_9BILA